MSYRIDASSKDNVYIHITKLVAYIVNYNLNVLMHRCVKELLDSSAAITKADKKGDNALHIACIHGQLHIVQFLLQRGLSAELRCVL